MEDKKEPKPGDADFICPDCKAVNPTVINCGHQICCRCWCCNCMKCDQCTTNIMGCHGGHCDYCY
jgi:hypothetical protein